MDVDNYAALVIDLTPALPSLSGLDLTGLTLEFSSIALQISRLSGQISSNNQNRNQSETIEKTITTIENVV
jgi:hypothetical protein